MKQGSHAFRKALPALMQRHWPPPQRPAEPQETQRKQVQVQPHQAQPQPQRVDPQEAQLQEPQPQRGLQQDEPRKAEPAPAAHAQQGDNDSEPDGLPEAWQGVDLWKVFLKDDDEPGEKRRQQREQSQLDCTLQKHGQASRASSFGEDPWEWSRVNMRFGLAMQLPCTLR